MDAELLNLCSEKECASGSFTQSEKRLGEKPAVGLRLPPMSLAVGWTLQNSGGF